MRNCEKDPCPFGASKSPGAKIPGNHPDCKLLAVRTTTVNDPILTSADSAGSYSGIITNELRGFTNSLLVSTSRVGH